MLGQPVSVYVGVDGPGRRQGLTALLDASPEFELVGASEADDRCLRSVVANRPMLVVLASRLDDPSARIADLVDKVHRGSPATTILVLGADPVDQPADADSPTAERYLALTAPLMETYAEILAAGRASHRAVAHR
jgi:DNA-binding NarL/FixJ family response regulator